MLPLLLQMKMILSLLAFVAPLRLAIENLIRREIWWTTTGGITKARDLMLAITPGVESLFLDQLTFLYTPESILERNPLCVHFQAVVNDGIKRVPLNST